jgi:hypothetical protein
MLIIAAWWFTKKVGGVVYSMSGESELFTTVRGSQLTEVVGFLNKLQAAVEAAKASLTAPEPEKSKWISCGLSEKTINRLTTLENA